MEVFLGRQPIFDQKENTCAYELLFRSTKENVYTGKDAVTSTSHVLSTAFTSFNIKEVVGGKKAFVNFPDKLLIQGMPKIFPREILVIEVLEDVTPSPEVKESLREFKREGYLIALDDFVYDASLSEFVKLADIIKVDFREFKGEARGAIIDEMLTINPNLKFLAEKVETKEEFEEAKKFGYKYFQGYFFEKPTIISTKDVPAYKLTYLRLLNEIRKEDIDFDELENIVKTDASLPYKLLRYINSVHFGLREEIKSIKQALVLLGIDGVRKWLTIVIVGNLTEDKPQELAVNSVVRGRFCELIGEYVKKDVPKSELFLLGLFSMIDIIVGKPKEDLLKEVHIPEEIKDALLGKENTFSDILNLAIACEKVEDEKMSYYSTKLNVNKELINELYWEALRWASKIFL